MLMLKFIKSVFFIPFICFGSALCQKTGEIELIEHGAKLEKLADGFLFTEGPAADSEGNVFFTDQPNDRIMKWSISGELTTFMQPCGRSNGLYFDFSGNLLACADEKNELWRIGPDKKVDKISGYYNGSLFNGPNDLWIAPDGGIYFTDPFYKRAWWSHTSMPQDRQCVYYLNPDRKTVIRVIDDLVQPNGIIGTPDGKTLYVADIGGKKTWSYTINQDGKPDNKKLFCEMGSDGMTIDEKGNLYLTGNGVTIFDRNGKRIGVIEVPESWTANVCFGDRDRRSLFITATKSLYRIRMVVKGAP
jgi:gluconolactonase